MRMNFGPINKGGGEKRLNVVFSRAKQHMAVVSSIDYTAITNQYNDGALCFRRYLQYAEAASRGDAVTASTVMGALSREHQVADAVSSQQDPVVQALSDALQRRGFTTQANLGASGFRVDLAVGNAGESELAVAVLVDTPERYVDHEAFEQHHIRPSVLRAFGWTVVNVLYKDWLTNPGASIARVVRALTALEEVEEVEDAEPS